MQRPDDTGGDGGAGQAAGGGVLSRLGHQAFVFFSRSIWEIDLGRLSWTRAWLIKAARVVYLAVRGFVQDRCLVRAGALTYVTILSIVPLLAVSFGAAKGFGFYDRLMAETVEPFLDQTFGERTAPDPAATDGEERDAGAGAGEAVEGEASVAEVSVGRADAAQASDAETQMQDLRSTIDEVLAFVNETEFGKIAWPALLIFLYAVIKMLGTVETTFNEIWGVTRSRSLVRKISDYLSMVLVTPVLLFLGAGLAAAAKENTVVQEVGLGAAVQTIARMSSWFAVLGGFTFLYLAMPNTKVRFTSALLGAFVATVLWLGVVELHVQFQFGIARANALYSSFAAVPIFLVFANLCWIVVLVGAELAFAHQAEPTYREVERPYPNDYAVREVIAVRSAARIAQRFLHGRAPATPGELALELGVPVRPVQEVLGKLAGAGVLADTERNDDVAYLPARPLDALRVTDVLVGLRGRVDDRDAPVRAPVDAAVGRMLVEIEDAAVRSEHNRTLRELAALPEAELADAAEAAAAAQRDEGVRGQGSPRSATT